MSSAIVDLRWTRPDSAGVEITRYEVQTSDDGSAYSWSRSDTYSSEETAARYEDYQGGTTVYYRVRAVSDNGDGAWSDTVSATTIAGAPTAPRNLAAVAAGNHQVNLTWDAPESNADASTRYRVEYIDTIGSDDWNDWQLADVVSGLKYSHTGLYQGTRYFYRAVAVNNAGTGPYTQSYVEVMTDGDHPVRPDAPSMVRFVSLGINQVTIAWDAPEFDGGRPVTGYEYRVRSYCPGTDDTFANASGMQVTIDALPKCDRSYSFRVRAVNALGEGDWSLTLASQVPTSSTGKVIVTPTRLALTEGGTGSQFVVKLGEAPTKPLLVLFEWEGDWEVIDALSHNSAELRITKDNWATGVTVPVTLAEGVDAVGKSAVFHVYLLTADLPPPSRMREMGEEEARKLLDPVFHNMSGTSVIAEVK